MVEKKKTADKGKKKTQRYCEYEDHETDCPDYEKSKHTNLCKWGMYEGSCVCYKDNQCTA